MIGLETAGVKQRNPDYVLNKNDSAIKIAVENWFKENMTNEVDSTKTDYSSL